MPLAPPIDLNIDDQTPIAPSKTYRLDLNAKRITSDYVDGLEALNQFVAKAWSTERDQHIIYDSQIGIELKELLSGNYTDEFLKTELQRVLKESVEYDERIIEMRNFEFVLGSDSVEVFCEMESIFGTTTVTQTL